jgi:glycerol-3-phosphate dehydrogenase (NAD(P)+)
MKVAVIGAGAMGSALTVPLYDNNIDICLYGTEYDIEILKVVEKGKVHPRLGIKLPDMEIAYPNQLDRALSDAEIILLAVSTEGVIPIFTKIKDKIGDRVLITISKGLLKLKDSILTIPEAIWKEKTDLTDRTVAITGPSIAKEVARKAPTKVVFSCIDIKLARMIARIFTTEYYRVAVSDDIKGAEITSALKNVYSIAIAWIRGYEQYKSVEMSNLKGVIASMAIEEIAKIVEAAGGKKSTVFGLSGFGDLIATFRGGRNGMLGELLGRGLSISHALEELRKRGVGVIEGYGTAEKAYKLVKDLEMNGKISSDEFPLLTRTYEVLFKNRKVEDVLKELI